LPALRETIRGRPVDIGGGVLGYPREQLYQEVAYIAYYFHWQPESILNLDHRFRRQWVREIASINKRLNQGA